MKAWLARLLGLESPAKMPADHAPCQYAIRVMQGVIADLRMENTALHNRLVAMHGWGVTDHAVALQEREAKGKIELEQMRKEAAAAQGEPSLAELHEVIGRSPYTDPVPVESA